MAGLLNSLPSCALACLLEATTNSTCGLADSLADISCICQNTELNAQLGACVLPACSSRDALTTKKFSYTTCQYPTHDDVHVFPVVNIVGMVVAIIAVLMRVAGRLIGSRIGLDDCAIVVSLAGAIAIAAIGVEMGHSGLGRDIWMLSFDQITKTMHLFYMEEVLYNACIPLIKASMLLLYLRLFPDEKFRLAAKLVCALTLCWGLVSLLIQTFSCQPVSYFWHMWDSEYKGKCIDHNRLLWAHAIINIVLDLVIIGMPMPTLVKLNLSLGKKLGILFMFAAGIVVTVISILRLVTSLSFATTDNPTKRFVSVGIWSLLEIYTGILCACMPGIRAFVNYTWALLSDKLSVYGSSRSQSNSGSRGLVNSKATQQPNGESREFILLENVESVNT